MGQTSFRELFRAAWRHSFDNPIYWVFGALIAFTMTLENFIPLPEKSIPFDEFVQKLDSREAATWFLLLLALFLIRVFGTSNLIVSLARFTQSKESQPSLPIDRPLFVNFIRGLLIEATTALFLLTVAFILLLPSLAAYWYNKTALDSLLLFGALTFIPIAIITFFVREFSLFYMLLSPLRLRSAYENGGSLFSQNFSRCVLFGLFSLAIFIVFTFCLNLIMLNISAIGDPTAKKAVSFIVSMFFTTWFCVLGQALWYLFFKDLAAPKKKEKEEKSIIAEKVPDVPSA